MTCPYARITNLSCVLAATYTSWECGPSPGAYWALLLVKTMDSDGAGEVVGGWGGDLAFWVGMRCVCVLG